MAAPAEEQQENNDGSTFDRLTGTQKSAILMMLIGEDEASEILRNLLLMRLVLMKNVVIASQFRAHPS